MTKPAQGLYAPRFVDFCFALMGAGSAIMLGSGAGHVGDASAALHPFAGLATLGAVLLLAASACAMHKIDQRNWDDYMAQIVTQSALIAMVTFLLAAVARDVILVELLQSATGHLLISSAVPMAALSWSLGYFYLRWKGTGA